MGHQVEIKDPDGKVSEVSVNNHIYEILKRMHLPPYVWSELIDANMIDAVEASKVKEQHYPKTLESDL